MKLVLLISTVQLTLRIDEEKFSFKDGQAFLSPGILSCNSNTVADQPPILLSLDNLPKGGQLRGRFQGRIAQRAFSLQGKHANPGFCKLDLALSQ